MLKTPSSYFIVNCLVIKMAMKKKKSKSKRSGNAPMPATGAGLIRFFQDEAQGIKLGPTTVIALAVAFMAIVIIFRVLRPIV